MTTGSPAEHCVLLDMSLPHTYTNNNSLFFFLFLLRYSLFGALSAAFSVLISHHSSNKFCLMPMSIYPSPFTKRVLHIIRARDCAKSRDKISLSLSLLLRLCEIHKANAKSAWKFYYYLFSFCCSQTSSFEFFFLLLIIKYLVISFVFF